MNGFWEILPDLILGLPLVILGLVLFLSRFSISGSSGKHGFLLFLGALGVLVPLLFHLLRPELLFLSYPSPEEAYGALRGPRAACILEAEGEALALNEQGRVRLLLRKGEGGWTRTGSLLLPGVRARSFPLSPPAQGVLTFYWVQGKAAYFLDYSGDSASLRDSRGTAFQEACCPGAGKGQQRHVLGVLERAAGEYVFQAGEGRQAFLLEGEGIRAVKSY